MLQNDSTPIPVTMEEIAQSFFAKWPEPRNPSKEKKPKKTARPSGNQTELEVGMLYPPKIYFNDAHSIEPSMFYVFASTLT